MSGLAETHTQYDVPYRPFPVAAYNRLMSWRAPHAAFDAERLLHQAQKIAKETQLSDAPLMAPLERLCSAIQEEAALSPFGAIVQATRLRTLVVNRLRLDAYMRKHPEILDGPEPDVILIAGLARTGTTLLHRVLAMDPAARSLPSWEAVNPAPLPHERPYSPKKRIQRGQTATRMIGYLAPDFAAVHPVAADQPEEDILLLDLTMISQTAESVTHVPTYSAWLETIDHRPAYAYFRKVLMVLNHLNPGRHWVLKSPHHSEQLAAIFDTFPKLTVVQTHRDPMKTMPSCCSLMAHTQGLSTDQVNPHAIGRHWLRKSKLMAYNAVDARKAHPERPVIDILYKDLIDNPLESLKTIYTKRGAALPGTVRQAALEATAQKATSTTKRHRYSLEDFGLTPPLIEATFGAYAKTYSIPQEGSHHA